MKLNEIAKIGYVVDLQDLISFHEYPQYGINQDNLEGFGMGSISRMMRLFSYFFF